MRFSCGASARSGNRDAEDASPDSGGGGGGSASLTSAGRSSDTSSHVATSFAPCLISVFRPRILVCNIAGHGENITVLLQRTTRRDPCSRIFRSLNHRNTNRHATQYPITDGKVLRRSECSQAEFGNESSPQAPESAPTNANFLSDKLCQPVPKYRKRFAFVRDRPAMTGSVDAARHAADDQQPLTVRSQANHSATPCPQGGGWRVPTIAMPGCVSTS